MKNSHWLKQYIHATRDDDRRQLLKQVVRAFEQDVLSKTDALPQGQLWWPCGQGVRWRNQFFVPTNCILSKKTRLFPCIFSEEFFQKIKNSRIFQSKKNVSTFLHFYWGFFFFKKWKIVAFFPNRMRLHFFIFMRIFLFQTFHFNEWKYNFRHTVKTVYNGLVRTEHFYPL